ncbi:NifU family protein [Buchnera aphidicola]|uniref:NifU family protein n=1 Tax=Buchnera aphidicola TaxID=9 RepID=UPI003464B802
MIEISLQAQKYLKKILDKQKKSNILRISIEAPGTKYATCKIFYDDIKNFNEKDIKIQYVDFNIFVDKSFIPYLKDSKIDLFDNDLEKQLMLMAPYANQKNKKENFHKQKITKNKMFLFQEVDHYIHQYINPMLLNHGGKIVLIDITDAGIVMIEFLGGCNGCAMSSTTVKEGIEKKILSNFSMLQGVQDVTKHNRGKHSFF